uniref:NR LBD domain-containing protein n=1 Tax=Syphacia muris TaxID=451379 RepID=A0A0N5AK88_9BILA
MFAESKTQETDCTVENQDKFDKVIPELKKRLGFAYVSQPSTASSASKSLSVHILATSLRIRYYCAKQQLDEALSEMTEVLNNESTGFDVQSKVSNSALDQLCETIKSTSNSIEQMRLFRRLQRILTKYSLRSPTDFVSLLYSDILIRQEQVDFARDDIKIDEETTKKILEISPYILCDN